ncbi:MAG: redox-regulated ATPase YchF [Aestuariivita sp.]|nr:redox-regulated ATPase YchF [Aestuariivita sp.]MCY4346080.1 redox-regulated ATPase YchF [Aestuariivita sp.]
MSLRMGIVGLPNVGKSTLFNSLTRTALAQAANFPFCTIDPNVGEVIVPDPRLDAIAKIAESASVIPARMVFVDIAGLVKGASKGEGLGNQFLANIREVSAISHVLRCFEADEVMHVDGRIDPLADAEIVELELILADLDLITKRLNGLIRKLRGGDKEAQQQYRLLKKAQAILETGRPARVLTIDDDDRDCWENLQLLSAKPVLFVCNVGEATSLVENDRVKAVEAMAAKNGCGCIAISARIEEEIAQLDPSDAQVFLSEMDLEEPGLDRLIRKAYALLRLQTFFTAGPKEARAWTIRQDTRAPQAAGVIHGDFESGFIRAETISFEDYVSCGGERMAKEMGKMRSEGKDYIVADGDILHILFNV